ncbi:MAG: hypothetical protein ACYS47_12235 [Planctomycetota bacterium]|jgi:hypothetical protein
MSEDDAKGGAPEPQAQAPTEATPESATPRDRPDLEALRARRETTRRRWRRFWIFFGCAAFLFLAAVVTDWLLKDHYRDLYYRQPWIEIQKALEEIDRGKVLDIHREKFRNRLDKTYLGEETYVIGRVTNILPGNPVEFCIDVPHFLETYDFHEDDVHVEWTGLHPDGVQRWVWVIVRGRVKSFGEYRLRMQGISIRPLRFHERYYIRKAIPPKRLTRDGVDSRSLFK